MLARGWHGVGPGGANPLCKGVSTLPPAELHDVSTQLARQLARSRGGLELKAEGGSATQKQLEAIAAMEAAGAYCCVAEGLDRALACLEAWGILRGRAV
jgi:hypothetical protein